VKFITRYDYEEQAKIKSATVNNEKSLTVQSDADAADINKIMARYEKTGTIVDGISTRQPSYGDFTEVKNYHETLSALRRVQTAFEQLPANLRNRFDNDPQKLVEFLDNSANDKEAVKLGLKDKEVLYTALDLDNKTKITPEDRASIDAMPAAEKAARLEKLVAISS